MNNTEKKEMKKKLKDMGQKSRYNERELSFISNTFFEREDLLMAIRKHFLQGELNPQEEAIIKSLTEETIDIIRKTILPKIDPDAPLYQIVDLWVSIDTINKPPEDAVFDMKARKIVIDYFEQELNKLKGGNSFKIIKLKDLVYNDKKDGVVAFVEMKARNTILTHIDRHIDELRVLAIMSSSVEEDEKLKLLDSNK